MLLIGNLISLLGCLLMVAIGFIRRKEHILMAQCAQFGFLALGNLALGAMAGYVSGVVSVTRNVVFSKVRGTVWLKLAFIAVQVVLTLWAGVETPVEWLPTLAAVVFTWFLDTDSAVRFKLSIMAGQALWVVYDLYYRNYVSFTFDILTILSNLAGIVLILKNKKDPLH